MKKTIMPGYIPVGYPEKPGRLNIEIEYSKDGRLSISGHYKDGGGQCIDELDNITKYAPGWDADKAAKLKSIWDRWHLNDMRAECEHQTALGWRDKAREEVTLYHWIIDTEASKQKRAAEAAAVAALKAGETFTPTLEQTFFAALPYGLTTHTPEQPKNYKPNTVLGAHKHKEIKTLGRLKPDEHPDGLLCKPCPVCGYERGSRWIKEEVPQDVIDWLTAL